MTAGGTGTTRSRVPVRTLPRYVLRSGRAVAGAAVGVLVLNLSWSPASGDPQAWMVILACLVGASLAVVLQRYVIIVGTAFGGAWTALVGALALVGHPGARAVTDGDLWQMYPLAPARGQVPFAIGWLSLGLLAALWQLLGARSAKPTPDADI